MRLWICPDDQDRDDIIAFILNYSNGHKSPYDAIIVTDGRSLWTSTWLKWPLLIRSFWNESLFIRNYYTLKYDPLYSHMKKTRYQFKVRGIAVGVGKSSEMYQFHWKNKAEILVADDTHRLRTVCQTRSSRTMIKAWTRPRSGTGTLFLQDPKYGIAQRSFY